MLLFIQQRKSVRNLQRNFKTSYVTVYPNDPYTLCSTHRPFQNIVCYCLSKIFCVFASISTDFKTSYVTVYLYRPRTALFPCLHFKTSYVTVYLDILCCPYNVIIISKHRMLLFIRDANSRGTMLLHFKTSYVTVYRTEEVNKLPFN